MRGDPSPSTLIHEWRQWQFNLCVGHLHIAQLDLSTSGLMYDHVVFINTDTYTICSPYPEQKSLLKHYSCSSAAAHTNVR